MTPHILIFALLGAFLLALAGILPSHGPRVASVLATIAFGIALVLVLLHP
jgi:hypothetical protein